MTVEQYVERALEAGASDIHLVRGLTPRCRVDGAIRQLAEGILSAQDCLEAAQALAGTQLPAAGAPGELDLARTVAGVRCRVNLFRQQEAWSAAIRLLSDHIPDLSRLGLPQAAEEFPGCGHGLVLITGETGSGKSTTLASILDRINREQAKHILTLEDPIEYVHTPGAASSSIGSSDTAPNSHFPFGNHTLRQQAKGGISMAKTRLGFDIGSGSLKIAVLQKNALRVEEVPIPRDQISDAGTPRSPQAFARFLRRVRKKLALPRGPAALVLPHSQAICRLVSMPPMTTEQLFLNLAYEFSDFIQGEAEQYHWDYAVCAPDKAENGPGIPMMAAVVSKAVLADYTRMFAQAGLRLRTVLPQEMALIQLCRARRPGEYCFVDLGRRAARVTAVCRDRVQAARQIAPGSGDPEFTGSPEDCERIAVELLKIIHFYQFTYRSSALEGVCLVGGGASAPLLRQSIQNALDLPLLDPAELLPEAGEAAASGIFAAGAAMRGDGK